MRIAVIGAGKVGAAIACALRRADHTVVFGIRAPDPAVADQRPIGEATEWAEVAVIAVPFAAVADIAAAATAGLAGKPVLDLTNPLGMVEGALGLTIGHTASGGERVAALLPGAHVIKVFNQTGLENLADALSYPVRPVMFAAGDDEAAKAVAIGLAADCGFEAIDAGGLRNSRLLEPLAMLWIELARKRGLGADFAFTLTRRN